MGRGVVGQVAGLKTASDNVHLRIRIMRNLRCVTGHETVPPPLTRFSIYGPVKIPRKVHYLKEGCLPDGICLDWGKGGGDRGTPGTYAMPPPLWPRDFVWKELHTRQPGSRANKNSGCEGKKSDKISRVGLISSIFAPVVNLKV